MRHVTFYHEETGILNGVTVLVSDDKAVALNEKLYPGHKAIDHPRGEPPLDHRRHRVDVTTGEVLAWDAPATPPPPEQPPGCGCPKHR